ncbi:hypothetical protein B0H11DRAFT_2090486 [Mycena galericulata]|nr:hypothetical protein B0H11DRAFT_2090486 [Mycena galericulata]
MPFSHLLRLFFNTNDTLLLECGGGNILFTHNADTHVALALLGVLLYVFFTFAAGAFWILSFQCFPWIPFRRLVLSLVSLLLLSLAVSPQVDSALRLHLGDEACILDTVATVWGFLTRAEKLLVVVPPLFLDLLLLAVETDARPAWPQQNPWARLLNLQVPAWQFRRQEPGRMAEDAQVQERPVQAEPVAEDEQDPDQERPGQALIPVDQEPADPWAALKDDLECSICMGLLRQPYITSCGHTFDLACLKDWISMAPQDTFFLWRRPITCPMCQTVLRTPPVPVYLLERVVNRLRPAEEEEEDAVLEARPNWGGIFV